jgi:hypothetical protein
MASARRGPRSLELPTPARRQRKPAEARKHALSQVGLDADQPRQVSVAVPVWRLAVMVGDIDVAGRREVQPGAYLVQVEDLTADFTVSG